MATVVNKGLTHMSKVSRQAGWAGLCAAVLGLAAMLIAGAPPDASAGLDALSRFGREQRQTILLTAVLYQLSVPFLFVFAAGLARVAAGADGEWSALAWGSFAGNVGLQAVAIGGIIPFVAAVWRQQDGDLLRLTYDTDLLGIYALSAGFSLASVVPVTIAALATRTLPWWVAVFAAILALANIAELAGLLFFGAGPMALGAGAGLVAVPAWLAWMAAASIALLRK